MSRGQPTEGSDQTGQARLLTAEHLRQIQDLITLLRKNNLTELEIEQEGFRIRLRHEVGVRFTAGSLTDTAVVAPQENQSMARESTPLEEDTSGLVTITSPIVGTFYRSPSPDADPYVEEGDYVKKGQVLCIVEAMKLMNEIESETDGRIVKILAESTKPVEYGQPLFLIDPKARA
jgi:acetyl-CoA carboxylase biotin carboxyl carrier protein